MIFEEEEKNCFIGLLFYANERKCDQLDRTSPIVIALGMGYRMPKHPLRFGQADLQPRFDDFEPALQEFLSNTCN